ncbi:MAG: GPR endopeptidase [Christensenellaceae bacterium]|nr:GPR endopeptidase [Christensenellaceae bacterium]
MQNFHTDLALEAGERLKGNKLPGLVSENYRKGDLQISEISLFSKETAALFGKECGRYYTVECGEMRFMEEDEKEELISESAALLSKLLEKGEGTTLIIGLGNRDMTPDALGPKTADQILVTRHLLGLLPEAEKLQSVCILEPKVTGITGIESADIAAALAGKIKPKQIIVIDALAAGEEKRIGRSIQFSDTGITPGSGIGNKRLALNKESLGVPVVAVGIPMVIYAKTLAFSMLEKAFPDEKIKESLQMIENDGLVVTPKEIDAIMESCAETLAKILNRALQPNLSKEEFEQFQ